MAKVKKTGAVSSTLPLKKVKKTLETTTKSVAKKTKPVKVENKGKKSKNSLMKNNLANEKATSKKKGGKAGFIDKENAKVEGSSVKSSSGKRKRPEKDLDGKYKNMKKPRYENRVFIGNLNFDSSYEDIKEAMSAAGNVVSLDLPMKEGKKQNRGYGIVEFADQQSKSSALKKSEEIWIDGRSVRIEDQKRGSKQRETTGNLGPNNKPEINRVFVKNIYENTTEEDIRSHFEKFGKISKIYLPRYSKDNSDGGLKGFGFIYYYKNAEMKKALAAENHRIKKNRIIVETSIDKNNSSNKNKFENEVHVRNIPQSADRIALHKHFSRYGDVLRVMLPFDKEICQHSGYAFVAFKKQNSMKAVLAEDHEIDGKALLVKCDEKRLIKLREGSQQQNGGKVKGVNRMKNELFVKNITERADEQSLETHFSRIGEIVQIRLPLNKETGKNKGFAFIAFAKKSSVTAALAEEHSIDGQALLVKYSEK